MALVRNLGRADRTVRILMGVLLCILAFLARAHTLGALVLAAAGIIIGVEGVVAH